MPHVTAIPALRDNYIWLIQDDSDQAVVVDPGEADPVIRHLSNQRLALSAILVTHHHFDHTGGISALTRRWPAPVIGPAADNISAVDTPLEADAKFNVPGIERQFTALSTPGHTIGQVAYCGEGHAFTGDTLFSGGCGRLFEGTAEQMWQSLCRLRDLPPTTRVYCGHEYTQRNLRFAATVEPNNAAIAERLDWADRCRSNGRPTLPSTIGDEILFNPFLRADESSVRASAERRAGAPLTKPAEVFATIRAWKDNF